MKVLCCKLMIVGCLLLLPLAADAAVLSGKATIDSKGVAGIDILIYPADVIDFNGAPAYRFGPTAADGHFSVDLPKGQYYLFAKGKDLFTFYGRNPVSVPNEGLENVNLLLQPVNLPAPAQKAQVKGGVLGVVTEDGKTVPGAIVYVYPDLTSQFKGMGLGMSAPTDAQGLFELPLPAGTYYLVVRLRQNGGFAGPLQAGDRFGYLPGNPLVLQENQVARVHVPLIEVPEKVERYAASMFGNTSITGKIVNAKGAPVAGSQAMLYDDPMMLNRPLYVSQKTGADGRFILSFPQGGVYYLAARDQLGGTPAPGEIYGRYQGSPDHSVRIRTGKSLENVEIVVEEVY